MTTNVKKLESFLKEYLPAMSETIPTVIDCGGCGWFAYNLSCVLDTMKVKHEILCLYISADENYDQTKAYVKGKLNLDRFAIDHIVIKIGDNLFDGGGYGDEAQRMYDYNHHFPITKTKLRPILEAKHSWNPEFDQTQEPKILKYLKAIPDKFKTWKAGTYTHKFDDEADKPLNKHTQRYEATSWF